MIGRVRSRLTAVAVVVLVGTAIVVLPATPAYAAETLAMTKTTPANVLVGAPTTVTLTVTNRRFNSSPTSASSSRTTMGPGSVTSSPSSFWPATPVRRSHATWS